jgi:hypothetical protein
MVPPRECGAVRLFDARAVAGYGGERGAVWLFEPPVSAAASAQSVVSVTVSSRWHGQASRPDIPLSEAMGSWGWLGKRAPGVEAGTRKGESASQRALPGPLGGVRVF